MCLQTLTVSVRHPPIFLNFSSCVLWGKAVIMPMFIALQLETEKCYVTCIVRLLSRLRDSGWPVHTISLPSLFLSHL